MIHEELFFKAVQNANIYIYIVPNVNHFNFFNNIFLGPNQDTARNKSLQH
jgi:hypothetical protein